MSRSRRSDRRGACSSRTSPSTRPATATSSCGTRSSGSRRAAAPTSVAICSTTRLRARTTCRRWPPDPLAAGRPWSATSAARARRAVIGALASGALRRRRVIAAERHARAVAVYRRHRASERRTDVDIDATGDQRELLDVSRRFIEDTCPLRSVRDGVWRDDAFAASYRRQAAELGWFSMLVPEELGGGSISGNGALDAALIAYHRGRGLQPGSFVGTNVVAAAIA